MYTLPKKLQALELQYLQACACESAYIAYIQLTCILNKICLQVQATERLDCGAESSQDHVAQWPVQSAVFPHSGHADWRETE